MKLKLQLTSGISFTAILTVILLITSPAIAAPSDIPHIGTDTYATEPNVELANVVPGIGTSVYATIYTFGGIDGTNIPVDTSADAFAMASAWFVASLNQDDFGSYLQRTPAPVFAPDGLSLHLTYPASMNANTAYNYALIAAGNVGLEYGVSLVMQGFNDNSFVFWANNSATASVESSVANDVAALGTAGFSALLDASVITSAPVFWSGFGARTLAGAKVAQFGAGWVDADGLTDNGGGEYTLSSATVFGGAMNPTPGTNPLSRVTFNFPYPIAPVENGFSPQTTNLLPHVTGNAVWDISHPLSWAIGGQTDLSVTFKLKDNANFPNVVNTFSVNQTKLETEGILEANFRLENTSPTDHAQNVDVFFPLGPDFGKIMGDKTIYQIDDANYELNVDHQAQFSISATYTSQTLLSGEVLDFSGWYSAVGGPHVVNWDNATTNVNLFNAQILGIGDVADVTLNSPNGFPDFFITAAATAKTNLETGSYSSSTALLNAVKAELRDLINLTLSTALDTYYVEKPIFVYDEAGSNMTLGGFEHYADIDNPETFYYMYSGNHTLAPGEVKNLTFRITDVPITADKFQFIDWEFEASTGGVDPANGTIVSYEEDWFSVMQYLFQLNKFDGRPISYKYSASVNFGLDMLGIDSFHGQNYVSHGAWVRYENNQSYPFFSLSNSQNVQIGDDEAVVSGVIELDKQVYYPGENRQITVKLSNTGSIPAENIKVHLYEATLNRGFTFDRAQKIQTLTLGSLAGNSDTTLTYTDVADSYVGYSPVYAYIEFDSDVGQSGATVRDYLRDGDTVTYEAAGETHHVAFSTLSGSLLIPAPGDVKLDPTIKEPKVEISKSQGEVDQDSNVDITYTLTNTGEANTVVYFFQSYNTNEVEVLSSSGDQDAIKISDQIGDYGYVGYSGINLDVGETKQIVLSFHVKQDAYLPAAQAYFSHAGDSTIGGGVNTGGSSAVNTAMLGLSAGSQAQEDSQKSANENGASSSYSASSSLGASVNTNVNTEGNDVTGLGFIGYDAFGVLALMAVPLTISVYLRRRR